MPMFSILVPAKGRPNYTRDAVFSVMNQNFDDFDVTFSNNGADPAVKAAVAGFMGDSRFHYIEQPSLFAMPLHWDIASRGVAGDYLLVLTNRCILKQGVLRRLSEFLRNSSGDEKIVSWSGDSYENVSGLLSPRPPHTGKMFRLKTADLLLGIARGSISMMHGLDTLPLAYNSCISRALVEKIRDREGHLFQNIAPDYNFAFSCLLNATDLVHFDEAFHVAQGNEDSNGSNAVTGDARPYMNSIGVATPWEEVPIKAPLVYNVFAQDFLAALRRYRRNDIRDEWNKFKYYKDCLMEIRIKKNAGILSPPDIAELKKAITTAMQNEDERIRALIAPPMSRRMLGKIKSLAKIIQGRGADMLRVNRRASGPERRFRTALQAAGFEPS